MHESDELVPRHIAIIMDGNGRWATKRKLPRVAGHAKGLEAVRSAIKACATKGVQYLTLFAFSSENWERPYEEVSFLKRLFATTLKREIGKLHEHNIRLRVVGALEAFGPKIQEDVLAAEIKTQNNSGLLLTIAANYGGRWDMVQAAQKLIQQSIQKEGDSPLLTENALAEHLVMAYAPDPDLLIRTGGEQRISNFLLWQLAYAELYFTDTFWPDFDETALEQALQSYQRRERRFGRTSGQLL